MSVEVRRRAPRLRRRIACALLGHRWRPTYIGPLHELGYSSRCSRCRLLR